MESNGYLLNKIAGKMKRLADENLITENVTIEQLMVMKMIYENGGTVPQKDIEIAFDVRRSTVTSAMQILEKKGFITRSTSASDSRAKIVSLTKAGQEKNERMINFIKQRDEKIFSSLNSEEKQTLSALLSKILNNM